METKEYVQIRLGSKAFEKEDDYKIITNYDTITKKVSEIHVIKSNMQKVWVVPDTKFIRDKIKKRVFEQVRDLRSAQIM